MAGMAMEAWEQREAALDDDHAYQEWLAGMEDVEAERHARVAVPAPSDARGLANGLLGRIARCHGVGA